MLKNMLAPVAVAIGAVFLEQAWWVRGLTGAVLGGILSIAIPALVDWAKERGNIANLRVDCFVDFLPTKLPPEGRVLVAELFASAETPPHQAGQSSVKYGDPGTITYWPPGSQAYKCEVSNLGPDPLFDVAIILRVEFREVVKHEESLITLTSGALVRSGDLSIVASRIEGKPPFAFWVTNLSPYFARVTGIGAAFIYPKDKDPRFVVNQSAPEALFFSPHGS
jgi:hypothetical protein